MNDDYSYLLKEYQNLKNDFTNQKKDIDILIEYFQSFASNIYFFSKSCSFNDKVKDDSFNFFTKLYHNLMEDIKKNFISEVVIVPLKKLKENYNSNENKIFQDYDDMKKDLSEGKKKLINAKNEYSEYIKEKNEIEKKYKNEYKITEGDVLFEAKRQNFFILYQYELKRMNETIERNNIKYNNIINELDSIKMNKESTFKNTIQDFAKMIGKIGTIFIEFEKIIKATIENLLKKNKNIIINNEIKKKFPQEENEFTEIPLIKRQNTIMNEFFISEILDNKKNYDEIKNNERKKSSDVETKDLKSEELIDTIIEKLTEDEEISSGEIYKLLEKIKSDNINFSFFRELKKFYKNRVIICKNKNNFVHLTNIFNDLIIKNNYNFKILNEIIEVSQMVKYKDIYLTSMIQKNNNFLSTKTFWMKLIKKNFKLKLDMYTCKEFKIKPKNDQKKKSEKEEEDFLQEIYSQVNGYKKLNKKQKIQLEEYGQKVILSCLSKAISDMCSFLISEKDIIDIFNFYIEKFKLGMEPYHYCLNILKVKFKKKYLNLNESVEQMKDKYGCLLTNKEIILLNAAKFLSKQDYINIFKINKSINNKLRNLLLKHQLTQFNITIDERLSIWEIFLNINELKTKFNYLDIKNKILNTKENEDAEVIEKLLNLDLSRTPLFRQNENHKKVGISILKCCSTIKGMPEYHQGMNFVLLFLYQLLNYDEEKTFYFFLALGTKTKYKKIFSEELKKLCTYFTVFDKILEISFPEIYYALIDKGIMTQFYGTPWFITLFTSEVVEFQKNNVPKFSLMAFESFIFDGWIGIFIAGLTLCYFNRDKIMSYDENGLMKFMVTELNEVTNINEKDFQIMHTKFLSLSEKYNERFIENLMEICEFEEKKSYMNNV